MEYRQNANWNENEHPRDSNGRFTDKQGGEQVSKGTDDSRTQRQRKPVALSKREYAIVDSARKQKFAEYRRNGIPKQDYVFTDGKFVIFTNKSRDNFVINQILDIEKDRDFINAYLGDLK